MKENLCVPSNEIYLPGVIDQFDTRASTFNKSAAWITDHKLVGNIVDSVTQAVPSGSKGIELCCGTGVVSRALLNAGMDMTGVDISPAMLKESGKHVKVTRGNVENLPFDDKTADFIVIRQALFLTDSDQVLEQVKRVLKPGGLFVVCNTVPFSSYDTEYLEAVHRVKQKDLHIFYTRESLKLELIKHGFVVQNEKSLAVQECIDRWMDPFFAPELTQEKRQEVLQMIQFSPKEYKKDRNVRLVGNKTIENWGWQIYSATTKTNTQRFTISTL